MQLNKLCIKFTLNNKPAKLNYAYRHFNPFLTLAFLALPVIPEIKLTDQGLFSVSEFRHIPIQASKPVD
ncbi:hypothetical protein FOA20_11020 [Peribacillus simplex]